MLIRPNFNSKAADVGCSVFNLAQMLADIEKGIYIDDCMGKISHPYAKPLLVGKKEEENNIFIEFESAMDGDPEQKLDPKEFFKNNNGIFINKLMEQRDNSGVFIPRPTKSHHPTGSCPTEDALLHMGRVRPVGVTLQRGSSTLTCVEQTY